MNCEAPGQPQGCSGEVGKYKAGMYRCLCETHAAVLTARLGGFAVDGPWKTSVGAMEWAQAMNSVVAARSLLEAPALPPEGVPEPGEKRFFWIGGSPGWDSSDYRFRIEFFGEKSLSPASEAPSKVQEKAKKKAATKRPNASGSVDEKTEKNRKNFWFWKKGGFRGKKKK